MNKITWLSLADMHLKLTDPLGKLVNRVNTRLQDKLDSIVTAVDYGVKHKVNFVVLLGDVFDSFSPHERLRELFIDSIRELICNSIPIIWVVGNHETDMHSFNFAATSKLLNLSPGSSKFQIVNKQLSLKRDGYRFSFIPSTYTDDQIILELDKVRADKTIVFGHWGTREAIIGEDEFRFRGGISHKHYEGFKQVYLGDFHKYQRYNNWMYVGSLNKITFSERSDTKGFVHSILDVGSGELENTFIPVDDREFIELEFNEAESTSSAGYSITGKVKQNAIMKVQFKGTKTWFYGLNKSKIIHQLYEQGAHKVFTAYTNQEHQENTPFVTVSSNYRDDIKEFFTQKNRKDLIDTSIKFLYR